MIRSNGFLTENKNAAPASSQGQVMFDRFLRKRENDIFIKSQCRPTVLGYAVVMYNRKAEETSSLENISNCPESINRLAAAAKSKSEQKTPASRY